MRGGVRGRGDWRCQVGDKGGLANTECKLRREREEGVLQHRGSGEVERAGEPVAQAHGETVVADKKDEEDLPHAWGEGARGERRKGEG